MRSVAYSARTAFSSPRVSAYSGHPTAWRIANKPESQNAARPSPLSEPEQQQAAVPSDRWLAVGVFAAKAKQTVEIEQEMKILFERRVLLARRLADGAARKDESLTVDSTRMWVDTELKLSRLDERYLQTAVERKSVLQQLSGLGNNSGNA